VVGAQDLDATLNQRSSNTDNIEPAPLALSARTAATRAASSPSAWARVPRTVAVRSAVGRYRDRPTGGTASLAIRGHAFIQNLSRGHYELGAESRHDHLRVAAAFDELAGTI